jgi:hypothetical protein
MTADAGAVAYMGTVRARRCCGVRVVGDRGVGIPDVTTGTRSRTWAPAARIDTGVGLVAHRGVGSLN